MKLHPSTLQKIRRFKSIRRGYYSLILLTAFIIFTCLAELFVNSRALLVRYEGKFYFPTYGTPIMGTELGEDYPYEVKYRELKKKWEADSSDNFIIMPIIQFNPYENNFYDLKDKEGYKIAPPYPPNFHHGHYLGTDRNGRDILARLIYAVRAAILFALLLSLITIAIGSSIGLCMGYWGGILDLTGYRLLEIFSAIPDLYAIIFVASIIKPSIVVLFCVFLFFGWRSGLGDMRHLTFAAKAREYVLSARALGSGNRRILFKHILPNNMYVIITALPFLIYSNITSLTSLSFLGFGLQEPTPSIGLLINQGANSFQKPWIITSVVTLLIVILVMVTFIGESLREAFDPRKYSQYE